MSQEAQASCLVQAERYQAALCAAQGLFRGLSGSLLLYVWYCLLPLDLMWFHVCVKGWLVSKDTAYYWFMNWKNNELTNKVL